MLTILHSGSRKGVRLLKRIKWNHFFVGVVLLVTMAILSKSSDINGLFRILQNSNPVFISLGLLCMLIFWWIEAGIMDLLLKQVDRRVQFWTALKTTLIGQYYSFLTPFASGGQPAQIMALRKDRVAMGGATAVLVSKFLIFQISVTLYAFILMMTHMKYFNGSLDKAVGFVVIGLTLNSIGISFITAAAFKPKWLEYGACRIIAGLDRIGWIRSPQKKIRSLQTYLDDYHKVLISLRQNVAQTLLLFALTWIQLTLLFSITYFVYRALGLEGVKLHQIVTLQALLYMAVSFIPAPGTAGASEVGFALILGSVFTSNFITAAMILWRGISYYFGLFFCGIFILFVPLIENRFIRQSKTVNE